jgi:hypothetical protein
MLVVSGIPLGQPPHDLDNRTRMDKDFFFIASKIAYDNTSYGKLLERQGTFPYERSSASQKKAY